MAEAGVGRSVEPDESDRIAAEQAKIVARELLETARRGGTEADFRREAAPILDRAAIAAGLTIAPRDEYTVACGRVDSLYNRLILEYKKPGVLGSNNSNRANAAVIEQIKGYIRDVAKRERRDASRLAGVATDGFFYVFVRQVGEGWSVDDPMPVNEASTGLFLRLLFSLCTGAALVPENLVEDFGPRTLRAQRAVRALYQTLESTTDPLVGKLFEQWKLFYSEATDYANWAEEIETKEEFRSFIRGMGIDAKKADPATVFYALHTYYALLIKLVAWLAAARFAGSEASPKTLKKLAGTSGDTLRNSFADLYRIFPKKLIWNLTIACEDWRSSGQWPRRVREKITKAAAKNFEFTTSSDCPVVQISLTDSRQPQVNDEEAEIDESDEESPAEPPLPRRPLVPLNRPESSIVEVDEAEVVAGRPKPQAASPRVPLNRFAPSPPESNGQPPTGDYKLTARDYNKFERGGQYFVEITWEVLEGPYQGRRFTDKVLVWPLDLRGQHFARAVKVEPKELPTQLDALIGVQVWDRRTIREDGSAVNHYYPPESSPPPKWS